MQVGKQSTLNDLVGINERITEEVVQLSDRVSSFEGGTVSTGSTLDFFQASNALFNRGGFLNSPDSSSTFYNAVRVAHSGNEDVVTVFSQSHVTKKVYVSGRRKDELSGDVEYEFHNEILTTGNTIIDANGFIKAS